VFLPEKTGAGTNAIVYYLHLPDLRVVRTQKNCHILPQTREIETAPTVRSLAVTSKAFLLDKFRISTHQVDYCISHPSKTTIATTATTATAAAAVSSSASLAYS
jgi:hypothetical protein